MFIMIELKMLGIIDIEILMVKIEYFMRKSCMYIFMKYLFYDLVFM